MRRMAWDPGHVLERESEEGLAVKRKVGGGAG